MVDRAHYLVHRAASRPAGCADDERNARTEIADGGIALPPGVELEEFHTMVGVDDDDRIVGLVVVLLLCLFFAVFVVELRYAAVVQVDELVEIEFLPGCALTPDDLERVREPGHREF